MRPGVTVKIIISEHKYAIQPGCGYFAVSARPAETVHYLPHFLERPRRDLTNHDHFESTH
jgi:hypothetical protein